MAKKLLDQLSDALRMSNYSYRTEQTQISTHALSVQRRGLAAACAP